MEARERRPHREEAGSEATSYRDARCATPDGSWVGRSVRLAGWVHRRRDLGGLLFVDLRDRSGLVQLAFGEDWTDARSLELAHGLGSEDVVRVEGEVERRPEDAVNPDMATGEIEVHVRALERLTKCDSLPILVAVPPEESLPSEELRLRYRYLDLRRPEMARNFAVRHRAVAGARAALDAEGFLEVETPLLTRRTPEGARDYVVPSRLHPGEFYALPQSPQLYKQLLMVSGFDRYYQVARCLRDEDLRADRQPEFSQIDVEMSFVGVDDVLAVGERMLAGMWREGIGLELELPFPRMTHAEALEAFGTDKPDLRIPWRLEDFTETLAGTGFRVIDQAVEAGGRVRGMVARDGARLSRADIDRLAGRATEHGAGGLLWLKRGDESWSGPLARFVDEERGGRLIDGHGVEVGDLVLLVVGEDAVTSRPLDAVRRAAAEALGAVDRDAHRWLWVTDFPLFERDPESGRPAAAHHPFTLPATDDPDRIREDPFSVKASAYDVVYNGAELCSGSIRCHDPVLQRAILATLGLGPEEIEERFGFLLEAFRFGVPPHGGYALGLDRTVMLMLGVDSIREVIAFPKTTAARGLMEGAPSPLARAELGEFGLELAGSGPARGESS